MAKFTATVTGEYEIEAENRTTVIDLFNRMKKDPNLPLDVKNVIQNLHINHIADLDLISSSDPNTNAINFYSVSSNENDESCDDDEDDDDEDEEDDEDNSIF